MHRLLSCGQRCLRALEPHHRSAIHRTTKVCRIVLGSVPSPPVDARSSKDDMWSPACMFGRPFRGFTSKLCFHLSKEAYVVAELASPRPLSSVRGAVNRLGSPVVAAVILVCVRSDYTCGPTSLSMLMAFAGKPVSVTEICDYLGALLSTPFACVRVKRQYPYPIYHFRRLPLGWHWGVHRGGHREASASCDATCFIVVHRCSC